MSVLTRKKKIGSTIGSTSSGGSGAPGGANGSIQYNNAGSFGGANLNITGGLSKTSAIAGEGFNVVGSKLKTYDRILTNEIAVPVTGFNSTVIEAVDIPDNSTIVIDATFAIQRYDGTTGYGGKQISTWRKRGGVLSKVGDAAVGVSNNTGDAMTIGTVDSAGAIQFTWSRAGIYSYYYGVSARITLVHE